MESIMRRARHTAAALTEYALNGDNAHRVINLALLPVTVVSGIVVQELGHRIISANMGVAAADDFVRNTQSGLKGVAKQGQRLGYRMMLRHPVRTWQRRMSASLRGIRDQERADLRARLQIN